MENKIQIYDEEFDVNEDKNISEITNYNIKYWSYNRSYDEVSIMFESGEIQIPDMQRSYVWSKDRASRLIESILLGLPIPSLFFFSEKNINKYQIVDGLQRIVTISSFIQQKKLPNVRGDVFKLSNIVHRKWAGKSFSELDYEDQLKIKRQTINIIEFVQFEDIKNGDSKYLIFERINTGSEKLTPQQIRNSIYRGKLNDTIIRIAEQKDFIKLFNDQEIKKLNHVEYVLRFFAIYDFYEFSSKGSIGSLKNFLNDYMNFFVDIEKKRKSSKKIHFLEEIYSGDNINNIVNKKEKLFSKTFKYILDNIGENAFKQLTIDSEKRYISTVHKTIFEGLMIAVAHGIECNMKIYCDTLEKKDEIVSKDFANNFQISTTSSENIRKRVNLFLGRSDEQIKN